MDLYTKCDHCGKMIKIGEINCTKCEDSNANHTFSPNIESDNHNGEHTSTPKATTPVQKFPVIFISSDKKQVGHIFFFNNEIRFKPSKYNIGELSEYIIPIKDICGYDLYTILNINIYTTDERKATLILLNAENAIKILENKRKLYFEAQGISTPELTKGKYNKNTPNYNNSGSSTDPQQDKSNIKKIKLGLIGGVFMTLFALIIGCMVFFGSGEFSSEKANKILSKVLLFLGGGIYFTIKNARKLNKLNRK